MKKNCSSCRFFSTCLDKNKGSNYRCGAYQFDPAVLGSILDGKISKKTGFPKKQDDIFDKLHKSRFTIMDSINEALDSNKLVPSDIRIPEENDLAEAKNFVEFCTREEFLNIKPFVRQLEIATKLFAEWCPICTDYNYFAGGGLQVTDSIKKFNKHVALLEYGVCPHCGARKSQLIGDDLLNFYEELACNSGQRSGKCLVGETLVKTSEGDLSLKELWDTAGETNEKGFRPLTKDLYVQTHRHRKKRVTHAYKTKGELIRIVFSDGTSLKGLAQHKLEVTTIVNKNLVAQKEVKSFKRLDQLRINDELYKYPTEIMQVPEILKVVGIELLGEESDVYDITVEYDHTYLLSCGIMSHNSAMTAMMYAYIVHRVIKAQRLVDVYGLLNNTTLIITFTALTLGQVKIALWDPFYGYISESKWFQDLHHIYDNYKHKTGEEVYKLKDTFLLYRHRKLMVVMNTPDTNKMRGATRLAASIDELGRFDNSANNLKIKINAAGVYEALQRSLRTVRSASRRLMERGVDNILPGYFINISSPASYRDKITSLVRESLNSKKLLGLTYPTWEFNPTITKDDLSEEFSRDPVGSMCDYGAQPPLVASPFIGSAESVLQNCKKRPNPIKLAYRKTTKKDGTSTLWAYAEKLGECGRPSVLAIDAGEVNNSFALVGGSLDPNGYPRLDLFVEVQTRPGLRLNHSKIATELIWDIIDTRNVVFVSADQWQSTKHLSDIEEEFDIQTRKYSLKYQDMVNFRAYIEDKEVSFPRVKWKIDDIVKFDGSTYPKLFKENPIEHFIAQCLTIQDTGSQVHKGENMTDDLWRAAALCFRMLVDEEVIDLLNSEPEKESKKGEAVLGIMKGFSGVSGNAGVNPVKSGDSYLGITSQRK